mmetsp:Transcript_22136/g.58656  ORF Transcript_22136/g.58656 Transcript_22136/m.58656 type:complete len:256 (-) Transcript_22136:831-1598(-)
MRKVQIEPHPCWFHRHQVGICFFTILCNVRHELLYRLVRQAVEVLSVGSGTGTPSAGLNAKEIAQQAGHEARTQRVRSDNVERDDGVALRWVGIAQHNDLLRPRRFEPHEEVLQEGRLFFLDSRRPERLLHFKGQCALHDLQESGRASTFSLDHLVAVAVPLLGHKLHGTAASKGGRQARVVQRATQDKKSTRGIPTEEFVGRHEAGVEQQLTIGRVAIDLGVGSRSGKVHKQQGSEAAKESRNGSKIVAHPRHI